MKIIGVGIGRTGTFSLKVALEKLGYRPCYHLLDVFRSPRNIKILLAVGSEENIDWRNLFKRYKAGVDFPLTTQYAKCLEVFPEAKVILTVRNPNEWYESAEQTVYHIQRVLIRFLPGGRKVGEKTIWYQLFAGRFEDRDYAIAAFNRHIEEVKRTVPEDQLLVFNVMDGWKPLCDFLDKPIPAEPFPHRNRRLATKYMMVVALLIVIALVISALYIVYLLVTRILNKSCSVCNWLRGDDS